MKNQKQLEAEQRLQENYDRLNDLVESLFPSNKLSLEDQLLQLDEDPYKYLKEEAEYLNSK
jgi:rRNA pseudouridine-1189 N-methylase Emg1 (Nep1/Mra1 family)